MKLAVIEKPTIEMEFFRDKKRQRLSLTKKSKYSSNEIPTYIFLYITIITILSFLPTLIWFPFPPFSSPEYSLSCKANTTPCSPLISVQPPQSPVLLTEHQIKKVSQLYICGLWENFPPLQRLSIPSLQIPTIPCNVVHHCAAPLMNTALLKSNLHCSDSLL